MIPPSIVDTNVYKLYNGMDTRYIEPWLECKMKQYFNDNLKGYIHGAYTNYTMHRNSFESYVNASPV